jgi:hypothetical protein
MGTGSDRDAAGPDGALVKFEIEKTLYEYSWSFDFERAEGIGACFTDDAVGDFGPLTTHGRHEMVAELERRRNENYTADEVTMHCVTNTWIRELTADTASATSYCTFYAKTIGALTWEPRTQGYYDDVFAPVGARWLIKRRRWMFRDRL